MTDGFKLGGPSPEARQWLKGRKVTPAFSYKDVWQEEHSVSFTVAKAMKADVLGTLKKSLLKANSEGIPYETWARDITPKLQGLGWWGKSEMTDPQTGEESLVQLGSPRRLKTIFESNMRAAAAAGQWDRIQETKEFLPFLIYELGPSENHRPDHAIRAGMIARVDALVWRFWFAPNGWGCKCRIRQISGPEAKRRGYTGVDPDPGPMVEWTNDRTGETMQVPKGIDPAWAHNPGEGRQLMAQRKLEAAHRDAGLPPPGVRQPEQSPPAAPEKKPISFTNPNPPDVPFDLRRAPDPSTLNYPGDYEGSTHASTKRLPEGQRATPETMAAVPDPLRGSLTAVPDTIRRAGEDVSRLGWARGKEHMIVLDGERVVNKSIGTFNNVSFSQDLARLSDTPPRRLDIVHNHPSGSPLSFPDVTTLFNQRGIRSIASFGHAGQVSLAQVNTGINRPQALADMKSLTEALRRSDIDPSLRNQTLLLMLEKRGHITVHLQISEHEAQKLITEADKILSLMNKVIRL